MDCVRRLVTVGAFIIAGTLAGAGCGDDVMGTTTVGSASSGGSTTAPSTTEASVTIGTITATTTAGTTTAGTTTVATGTTGTGGESTGGMLMCPEQMLASMPMQSVTDTNAGTVDDTTGMGCENGPVGAQNPDVAFAFTAPNAATYVMDTVGSTFDTALYVLEGNADCNGTEIACNDDGFQTGESLLAVTLTAGQDVTVVVDGFFDQNPAVGDFTLNIDEVVPDGDCCMDNGTPGCMDPMVQGCVCAVDPVCCAMGWDAVCVGLVTSEMCGTCVPGNEVETVTQGPGLAAVIPDNGYDGTLGSMVCVDLVIAANGTDTVVTASVEIGIDHTYIGDLVIKLRSPTGTLITAMSRPGALEPADDGGSAGAPSNPGNLVAAGRLDFADGNPTDAENAGNGLLTNETVCIDDMLCDYFPNPGAATAGNFASLAGETAVGTWQVCVGDSQTQDNGTIDFVALTVEQST